MPSGVSDYGTDAWLNSLFGITDPIEDYFIALCTDEPGPQMDGDIISDLEPDDPSGYARVHVGVGDANWATNAGFITNVNDIDFGLPAVDWGYISHFCLCTASTSGDIYAWGEFLNPQLVLAQYQMLVPAGGLVITLAALDNSIAI